MVCYNLVQYLINTFPDLNFVADALSPNSPEDCILVKDSGGTVDHNSGRPDITFQFLSRSKNSVTAKIAVDKVFTEMQNRFGLELPEVTVYGTTYEAVTTWQIVPIQKYGYLGTSNENYHMYSFNSIVTLDYS